MNCFDFLSKIVMEAGDINPAEIGDQIGNDNLTNFCNGYRNRVNYQAESFMHWFHENCVEKGGLICDLDEFIDGYDQNGQDAEKEAMTRFKTYLLSGGNKEWMTSD